MLITKKNSTEVLEDIQSLSSSDIESITTEASIQSEFTINKESKELAPKATNKLRNPFFLLERKRIWTLIIGIGLSVISGLTPAISCVLLGRVFNTLSSLSSSKYHTFGAYIHDIAVATSAILILGAGNLVVVWANLYIWLSLGECQVAKARKLIFDTYIKKLVSWYDTNEQTLGDLTLISRCVEEFRAGISEAMALTLTCVTTLVASICVSFYFSVYLTLVVLASFPLIILFIGLFSTLVQKSQAKENAENVVASEILNWMLSANQLIKNSIAQETEIENFRNSSEKSARHFIRTNLLTALQGGILKVFVFAIFIQAFWFGSHLVKNGDIMPGTVLVCLSACLIFSTTFAQLTQQFLHLSKAYVAGNTIFNFLNEDSCADSNNDYDESLTPEKSPQGNIKFENITFSYPSRSETAVLNNITFEILPNQVTYVVGKSGSGKSTLAALLLRIYDSNEGNITLDGTPINNISPVWLAKNITLVQQDSVLFNVSLKDNIALGFIDPLLDEKARQENLIDQAIENSCFTNVAKQLPNGTDTIISTEGASLSGGQQQRVTLARALVRDTEILILDEAFSALDNFTRKKVLANLKALRAGKTTIIVSHKLDEIENTDYVLFLEDGKLAEEGYKGELQKKPGSYFNQLQSNLKSDASNDISSLLEKGFEFVDKKLKNIDAEKRYTLLSLNSEHAGSELALLNLDVGSHAARRQRRNAQEELILKNSSPLRHSTPFWRRKKVTLKDDIEGSLKTTEHGNILETQKLKGIHGILWFMFKTTKERPTLGFGILAASVNGCVAPIFSYFLAKLITGIVPQDNSDVGSKSYNLKWSMVVLAVILADGFTSFLKQSTLGYASEKWVLSLRQSIFKNLIYQDSQWFNTNSTKYAEICALLMNDARDLRDLVSEYLSLASAIVVTALLGLVWALVIGWKLSLVGLSLMTLFAVLTHLYSHVTETTENKYKLAVAALENGVHEAVVGIRTIKCLTLELFFVTKLKHDNGKIEHAGTVRAACVGVGVALSTFLSYAAQMLLLYYGCRLVGQGEYRVSQLMQVYSMLIFTVTSIVQAVSQLSDISRGQRAGTFLIELTKLEKSPLETRGCGLLTQEPSPKDGDFIKFNGLNFAYDAVSTLRNINISIKKGETIAIVGESGSGKSTIASLISRFYSIPNGKLFINGKDINGIDVAQLRRSVGVVQQRAVFFKGSILENLTYGLAEFEDYTIEDVHRCLRMVNMHDFIVDSLPQGLETVIGGEASNSLLSGGQAQRLSIARTMLRRPSILIMDECTSALDAESSRKVCDFIRGELGSEKITTLLITHSKEVMDVADRVIEIYNGTIVS